MSEDTLSSAPTMTYNECIFARLGADGRTNKANYETINARPRIVCVTLISRDVTATTVAMLNHRSVKIVKSRQLKTLISSNSRRRRSCSITLRVDELHIHTYIRRAKVI